MEKKTVIRIAQTTIAAMAVIGLSSVLLTSCGGERQNDPLQTGSQSLDAAQSALVNNQILPDVKQFVQSATAFETSAQAFCNNIDTANLATVQSNWKTLSEDWSRVEQFNFGPFNDDLFDGKYQFINSYRLRGTNYTSTVRADIKNRMASNDTYDFSNLNFNLVGLLALEVMVFETTDATPKTANADIVADFTANPRKCYLLNGMATLMKDNAVYIDNGWNQQHLATGKAYKDIYLTGKLDDGSESLTTLLVKVQEHLDYIKKRNVLSATAKLSQHAYANAQANIDAIDKLMTGTTENSFYAYMTAAGHQAAVDTVKANIASAKQALLDKDQASYEAAIGLLDGNFKREIPTALAVSLGLNFSDGD